MSKKILIQGISHSIFALESYLNQNIMDIAKRSKYNPLLRPTDLKAGINGMEITCLLNPGVFRMNNKTWLLLRVAERPTQVADKISFPIYTPNGTIEVLTFDKNDSQLDLTDPRVILYKGKNYLTTLSYLRLVCSDDDIHFYEEIGRASCRERVYVLV